MNDLITVDNIRLKTLDERNHKGFLKIFSNKYILKNINTDFISQNMKCSSLKDCKTLYKNILSLENYFGYVVFQNNNVVGYIDGIIDNDKAYIRLNILKEYLNERVLSKVFKIISNNLFDKTNVANVYLKYSPDYKQALKKSEFILLKSKLFSAEDYFVLVRGIREKLYTIDDLYTKEFSESKRVACGTIFKDTFLPDKYLNNYISLNKTYLSDDIKWYYSEALREKLDFVAFKALDYKESSFSFIRGYEHDRLSHYLADYNTINKIVSKKNVVIKEVSKDIDDDFIRVMYVESKACGEGYAKRNSKRMYDVILNDNCKVKYYFLYKDNVVIGYISAFICGDYLKLEDFKISNKYRCMGYGKTLLKGVCKKYNAKYIYLLCESNSQSVSFYKHLGFKNVSNIHMIRKIF